LRRAGPADLAAFRSGCLAFTAASSLTGCPELVVPVRHLPSGHTFGAGILAPVHGDATLLHLAGVLCPDGGPVEVG
jgi:Asp-tRNA(Asn)/Glu-tRNA(Gln) amidotransferase A subunit family amidase